MKKLKTLCAVVGVVAMLYGGAALAAEQKYEVPEYDLKDAKKTAYTGEKIKYEEYQLDRNKDGITDLTEINLALYDDGELTGQARVLFIDDDFDGFADRLLRDMSKEDGTPGTDGIYDEEYHISAPMDLTVGKKEYKAEGWATPDMTGYTRIGGGHVDTDGDGTKETLYEIFEKEGGESLIAKFSTSKGTWGWAESEQIFGYAIRDVDGKKDKNGDQTFEEKYTGFNLEEFVVPEWAK